MVNSLGMQIHVRSWVSCGSFRYSCNPRSRPFRLYPTETHLASEEWGSCLVISISHISISHCLAAGHSFFHIVPNVLLRFCDMETKRNFNLYTRRQCTDSTSQWRRHWIPTMSSLEHSPSIAAHQCSWLGNELRWIDTLSYPYTHSDFK